MVKLILYLSNLQDKCKVYYFFKVNKFLLYINIFRIRKFNVQVLHECTRIFYPFHISKMHVIRTCISNVPLFQNVYIFPQTVTSSLCCMHFKSAEESCDVLGMYTLNALTIDSAPKCGFV